MESKSLRESSVLLTFELYFTLNTYKTRHEKICFFAYAENKGTDRSAPLFIAILFLDSEISLVRNPKFEPHHEKTNILVSDLVRHKPGCTAIKASSLKFRI